MRACVLPLAYNRAMSGCDNGVWALGDVRALGEARLVGNGVRHVVEMLPDLIRGVAAVTVAPPADVLLPAAHARPVGLPDAPLVQTAVCWRAEDGRQSVAHLVCAVADPLFAWARKQRAGERWAPSVRSTGSSRDLWRA